MSLAIHKMALVHTRFVPDHSAQAVGLVVVIHLPEVESAVGQWISWIAALGDFFHDHGGIESFEICAQELPLISSFLMDISWRILQVPDVHLPITPITTGETPE